MKKITNRIVSATLSAMMCLSSSFSSPMSVFAEGSAGSVENRINTDDSSYLAMIDQTLSHGKISVKAISNTEGVSAEYYDVYSQTFKADEDSPEETITASSDSEFQEQTNRMSEALRALKRALEKNKESEIFKSLLETKDKEDNALMYRAYAVGENQEVELEIAPDEGYKVDEILIAPVEDLNTSLTPDISDEKVSFVMPQKDVIVTATFSTDLSAKVEELGKEKPDQNSTDSEKNSAVTQQSEKETEENSALDDESQISAAAENGNSDAAENSNIVIESLTSSLFYGATKVDSTNYVWTPLTSASGHRIAYRVSFSTSGVGEAKPESISFTIPKTILTDRSGKRADEYEMSIPSKEDVDAYLAGTGDPIDKDVCFGYYEEGDNIIIYNFRELTAATDGYFEMAYFTTQKTFEYVDMANQKPFTVSMSATSTAGTAKASAKPINVKINTTAEIKSTKKNYPGSSRITAWNSSWGNECKPSDPSKYFYLIWRIDSEISATQPYNFKLEDKITGNHGDLLVLGYKFAGTSSYVKSNIVKNQTLEDKRYDYVLTAIPKDSYDKYDYWKAVNNITSIVDPIDQIDTDTNKKSSATWTWTRPEFTVPTGHFMTYKRADGAWRRYYEDYHSIYPFTSHFASFLDMKANEYSRYDLESFNGYDGQQITNSSMDGFDYASWIVGYPYPWTYDSTKGGPKDPSAYGHKKVNYSLTDEGVYLTNDAGEEDAQKSEALTADDFYFNSLGYSIYMRDAEFDEETQKFVAIAPTYSDTDVITFYGKFNGSSQWTQFGTYNLKTKAINYNKTYVESMSSSKVVFKNGADMTAYKLETSNAKYYTEMFTVPNITLKNSEKVMNFVKGKTAVGILNNNKGVVTDSAGKEIFSHEEADTDYMRISRKDSELKKKVVSTANNTKKKFYTLTWKVSQKETITYGADGKEDILQQESGTFYDLLPKGASIDIDSIDISYTDKSGEKLIFAGKSAIKASTIENYKNTGRTMLIVNVSEPGYNYNLFYDTIHSWDSIKDYGNDIYNPVAYATGNDSIAYGFADNGGKTNPDGTTNENAIKDADLMAGLDPNISDVASPSNRKLIYSEEIYDLLSLTAATSGLKKRVKAANDKDYSYATDTSINETYSYQLRYMNNYQTYAKDLIFYDSIENYNYDNMSTDNGKSDWHGTLQGIDVNQLKDRGIAPVIYYSTVSALDLDSNHDLTDSSVWKKYSDGVDKTTIKAIAIDMRKQIDGSDFILAPGDSVAAYLYMKAPSVAPEIEDRYIYTYNNVYLSDTLFTEDNPTQESYFIHQDYTSVRLITTADVLLEKVSADNTENKIAGIKFRLRGTSDYGTAVDEILTTDKSGSITFEKVEKGKYILQEYEATADWLLDPTEYTVEITSEGKVLINDIDYTDKQITITNKPRVHGDFEFTKKEASDLSKNDASFIISKLYNVKGAKFQISGTSDYGNDIILYAESGVSGKVTFNNIEMGTYEMKEISTNPNYVLSDIVWTVACDEFGNVAITDSRVDGKNVTLADNEYYYSQNSKDYILNDYKFWDFAIRKIDAENNDIWLQGAKFNLSGISDFGNEYNLDSTSGENGLARFTGIEKGTYILQELEAPKGVTDTGELGGNRNYIVDPNKYIVNVSLKGEITIDGLEKEDGKYVFDVKNGRSLDGKITITKVWDDGLSNDERPIPKVHISTQEPQSSHNNNEESEKQGYPVHFKVFDEKSAAPILDEKTYFEIWDELGEGVYFGDSALNSLDNNPFYVSPGNYTLEITRVPWLKYNLPGLPINFTVDRNGIVFVDDKEVDGIYIYLHNTGALPSCPPDITEIE